MHAIAFDLRMDLLGYAYGNSCSKACEEIRREMESIGFEWIQGNIYLSRKDSLASVYKAMNRLSQIPHLRTAIQHSGQTLSGTMPGHFSMLAFSAKKRKAAPPVFPGLTRRMG